MKFASSSAATICSVLFVSLVFATGCRRAAGPVESRSPGGDRVVRLFNWYEYINPEVVSRFTEATGIRVEIENFGNQEELVARVRSGPSRYDVIVIEDSVIDALNELGLLRELDAGQLPNRKHLDPRYLGRPSDPHDRYSMPYHWGTTLLAFRRDKVEGTPTSWSVLWDERYAGHIWMLSDVEEVVGVATLASGFNLNTVNTDELEVIHRRVLEQVPWVERYADTVVIKQGLAAGDCWLAVIYSGDAAQAARENPNVGYVIPDEGAPMWVDNLCIPRDALNVREAHEFINFLMDPEIAALNANYLRYATPNASARAQVDPALLSDAAICPPPELLTRCSFYEKMDQPRQRFFNRVWADILRLRKEIEQTREAASPAP